MHYNVLAEMKTFLQKFCDQKVTKLCIEYLRMPQVTKIEQCEGFVFKCQSRRIFFLIPSPKP